MNTKQIEKFNSEIADLNVELHALQTMFYGVFKPKIKALTKKASKVGSKLRTALYKDEDKNLPVTKDSIKFDRTAEKISDFEELKSYFDEESFKRIKNF